LIIRVGDMLGYDAKYFEVTSVREPMGVFGLEDFKMAILVNAVQVREEVFSPHKVGVYNEGDINPDSNI